MESAIFILLKILFFNLSFTTGLKEYSMASRIRNVRLTPIAVAVIATMAVPISYAQSTDSKSDQEVVVSGSRIKRDNYSTSAPVQIIRNEDSVLAGFTSTAEVLQGTAVTGGQSQYNNAFGGYVIDGGPGVNTLGLRGLSATRSLILLNGRRMSPSGTRGAVGATDLNTLPTSIVDRIEVLKDGSSSIYGSDAVTGVVNIITKNNLTGVTANLNQTATDLGGGNTTNFSLAGGFVGDRARFSGSYQYTDRKELTLGDRAFTSCPIDYTRTGPGAAWGSGDYIDPVTGKSKCFSANSNGGGSSINVIRTNSISGIGAVGSQTPGTVGIYNRWRPNASITTGLVGFEGVGNSATNINVRDTFAPEMLKQSLYSPTKNHNLYGQGSIDLDVMGGTELYYEAMFNRRDSSQTGWRQTDLSYSKGSPLIPAALSAVTYAPASASNLLQPTGVAIGVSALVNFGNYQATQLVDFNRMVVGFRGALAKTGWDYDVAATSSSSKGQYMYETILTDRLKKSLDVVASGSGYVCRDATGGCIAAPMLTAAVIGGQLPADWKKYVQVPTTGYTDYKEDVITGTSTGTLFNMPAGKVKAAVGFELRNNSINDQPAPESQAGNLYGFTSALITKGKDKARDLFGEVEIPLAKNVPGAQELTVNASTRFANYESYGSANTSKLGGFWAVDKSMSFRASKGNSYRAPALFEMYQGATSGFAASSGDPCNDYSNTTKSGFNPSRAANCASEGLPAGFNQVQGITVYSTGGAAAGLKAETSKNTSFGFVMQPELPANMGDLSIAVDRFNILVSNGVSKVSTATILSKCYDSPAFRSGGGFCNLITRNGDNSLTIINGFVNLAQDSVKGFDITSRYTTNVSDGKLRVNTNLTKYTTQAYRLYSTDKFSNSNGFLTNPKWSGNLDVNYASKDWTYFYGMNWVGKTSNYAYYGYAYGGPDDSPYQMATPNYFTHNISLKYKDPVQKWDLVFGVRNLTGVVPPSVSAAISQRIGNAPLYSGYDLIGRTYFANLSKSF